MADLKHIPNDPTTTLNHEPLDPMTPELFSKMDTIELHHAIAADDPVDLIVTVKIHRSSQGSIVSIADVRGAGAEEEFGSTQEEIEKLADLEVARRAARRAMREWFQGDDGFKYGTALAAYLHYQSAHAAMMVEEQERSRRIADGLKEMLECALESGTKKPEAEPALS